MWLLDFEFISEPGSRPVPVCMVAKELISGRLLRLWRDDLPTTPPFDTGPNSLFVAYMAAAEISCFLELGWPVPERVLDLYVEFRAKTNGQTLSEGRGLLGALSYHGITGITSDEKHDGRALVMRGGPWTDPERRQILDYCQTDVDALAPLLERMLPNIMASPAGLGQALLRGRYMAAVARMERTGVPIDVPALSGIRAGWQDIKLDLIKDIDRDFGIYEGTTFKAGLFADWLHEQGIDWPRTPTGRLKLDQDTFRDMAKTYPELGPIKELRHALGEMRLEKLAVGPDGRNRASLFPFGAKTGRNTPSNNGFIFGPSVWLRGLIRPVQGQAIAYVDWSSQEVAIAAALSGDAALLDAIATGDPYLAFAKRAGLAPPEATKETHGRIRDVCKTCVLGINYGMGAKSLAYRTGISVIEAERILRALATTFPVFWEWSDHVVDIGILTGHLATVYGWPLLVAESARSTSLRNYPMQGNGAEMLRIACCLATERGINVCAPVHDALLIESSECDIEEAVANTRAAMAEASRAVLSGLEVGTDVESIVRWPGRYSDPRGKPMWDRVSRLLEHRGCKG
ncbi:DNA polymerase [Streptomyces sp. NBC_00322]|uniref:DNA polymerase n=1 Tax=Streptomyces sp. NBC_00322 TaxID=2975712 RepID=UPI002E2C564E|nr:DNA polymerase [Streptomyces sp. NBC_00322]